MAEIEVGGVQFRGGKMFAVLTVISTAGGALWGGFEFYSDYMNMKDIVQNIDVDEIKANNQLVVNTVDGYMVRVEESVEYARDIKNDLREDILQIEALVDKNETAVEEWEYKAAATINAIEVKMDASEDRIKQTQRNIEATLETIRDEMNEMQKEVTYSIREVEGVLRDSEKDVRDVMKETTADIEFNMDELEADIKETIEEALDNPLND
jgi:ribosomal protein S3AE